MQWCPSFTPIGDEDTHARCATEVQWWSDQSLCHVAVNEMGAGAFSARHTAAIFGTTSMLWLRAPIMLVIGGGARL